MNYTIQEWLNLIFRWVHVFAAILWIGQTWLFMWLDARLHDPKEEGAVWMVHSGGFYVVNKETRPQTGRTLHWFRWEAAITWLSGALLLTVVYYMGGLLIDSESPLSLHASILASVGLMIGGWFIYDALWISPVGRNGAAGAVISFLLLMVSAWASMELFSSRAAWLQVGGMMGTLMAVNVWARILPAQRRLIASAAAGDEPEQWLADQAKGRSKHNSFMVVPVVLIMLSNHFPIATYGNKYTLAVLGGIILVGWAAASVLRTR